MSAPQFHLLMHFCGLTVECLRPRSLGGMPLELFAFSETPRAGEIPFVMKSACYVSFYLFVLSFLKPSVVFSCPSPWEGDDCTDFVTICPAGHKCHYGGECTNIGCTCPPGRVGHSCRFRESDLRTSPKLCDVAHSTIEQITVRGAPRLSPRAVWPSVFSKMHPTLTNSNPSDSTSRPNAFHH